MNGIFGRLPRNGNDCSKKRSLAALAALILGRSDRLLVFFLADESNNEQASIPQASRIFGPVW